MDKKVFGYVAIISLISMVFLFLTVLLWAVNNDYVIATLVDVSSDLASNNVITNTTYDNIDATASVHAGYISYFDNIWFMVYMVFIGSTVTIAYFSSKETDFSFLGMLFYGSLFFLFMVFIINSITDWFSAELLYNLIPNLEGQFPKFDIIMNNIGLISLLHFVVLILTNYLDLDFGNSKGNAPSTDKEDEVL